MQWIKIINIQRPLLTDYNVCRGHNNCQEFYKNHDFRYHNFRKIEGRLYLPAKEIERAKIILKKDIIKNTGYLIRRVALVRNNFAKEMKTWGKIDWHNKTNQELKTFFEKFIKEDVRVLSSLEPPVDADFVLTEEIKNQLKRKITPARIDEYFGKFSVSVKETETFKERIRFLELGILIKRDSLVLRLFNQSIQLVLRLLPKRNPKFFNKIKKHHQSFAFLGLRFLAGQPYTLSDFIKRIKEIIKNNPEKELKEIQKKRQADLKTAKDSLKKLHPSKELIKLIKLLQEDIFVRTWGLEQIFKGYCYVLPLLYEIARRLDLTYEELVTLLPEEISQALSKKKIISKKIIKERLRGRAVVMKNDKIRILIGEKFKKLEAQVEAKVAVRLKAEIRGVCASPGKVKGRVKLILDRDDLQKIEEGDILVTETTTPDFVPAMRKAGAIVTDIGGITTHAAIASRELGVPCVIGTQIGTKVLKDNNFVEVNADEGIIKIYGANKSG